MASSPTARSCEHVGGGGGVQWQTLLPVPRCQWTELVKLLRHLYDMVSVN